MAVSDEQFIGLWMRHGNPTDVAKELAVNIRNVFARRNRIEKRYGIDLKTVVDKRNGSTSPRIVLAVDKVRAIADIEGYVIVFSDAHFYPGEQSTGLQALVKVIKNLKPKLVIANGDILDGSTIHSYAPQGWDRPPTLAAELEAVKDAMGAIEKAAKGAILHRTIGNHDIRFDRRLAAAAVPVEIVEEPAALEPSKLLSFEVKNGRHSQHS